MLYNCYMRERTDLFNFNIFAAILDIRMIRKNRTGDSYLITFIIIYISFRVMGGECCNLESFVL